MEAHISVYVHRYSHIEHINSFQGVDMRWGPTVFGMLRPTAQPAQEGLVWDVSHVALLTTLEDSLK